MSDHKNYDLTKLILTTATNASKLESMATKLLTMEETLKVIKEMLEKLPKTEEVSNISIKLDAIYACGNDSDGKFTTPAHKTPVTTKSAVAKTKSKNATPNYLNNVQTFFKKYFTDPEVMQECIDKKLFTPETIIEQKQKYSLDYNAKKNQQDKDKFLATKVYNTFAHKNNTNQKVNKDILRSIMKTVKDDYIKRTKPPLEKEAMDIVAEQGKKINEIPI